MQKEIDKLKDRLWNKYLVQEQSSEQSEETAPTKRSNPNSNLGGSPHGDLFGTLNGQLANSGVFGGQGTHENQAGFLSEEEEKKEEDEDEDEDDMDLDKLVLVKPEMNKVFTFGQEPAPQQSACQEQPQSGPTLADRVMSYSQHSSSSVTNEL